ncbi:S-methyl-5-thioribose kinase [Subtercola sp. PAMC28395]|uniref:S-methyl-5-thioribose kinase n=1 Tax=Subtercola sp. PAMC28395 TaxID=2846775 RepID=UPI001C0AB6AE|nr:S-methyl-5-thioribose kinase [Subtercola sp. PAMC28395]QWT24021.1 S-methyl-5-thioribose kinase [Subtercola sp. PAMC28395]
MIDFSILTADTVVPYLSSRAALAGHIDASSVTSVREVGDGNLNLVFIVGDARGASLVLKQSLPHVRTDPSWPMTRERSAREATVLAHHFEADASHVPALYDFDDANYILAIEDLSDHAVWRNELNSGRVHAYAADDLGQYAARAAFSTSPVGLSPLEHKLLVARAINPELCEITEDLVFTEPYIEHEHNAVLPANEPDVRAIQGDRALVQEIGLAKLRFMTVAQSLIHGDLHTGSVFVRAATATTPASVRAFDSEFGFVGPTGFDLGALWANFVIAAARAEALGDSERAALILTLPSRLWASFEAQYRALWPARLDPRVWNDDVLDALLAGILDDAIVFAGAKCIRRIIGFAKASDIESLEPPLREGAARGVLRAGRALALAHASRRPADDLSAETALILKSAATPAE